MGGGGATLDRSMEGNGKFGKYPHVCKDMEGGWILHSIERILISCIMLIIYDISCKNMEVVKFVLEYKLKTKPIFTKSCHFAIVQIFTH